jgi:hypothetical protein
LSASAITSLQFLHLTAFIEIKNTIAAIVIVKMYGCVILYGMTTVCPRCLKTFPVGVTICDECESTLIETPKRWWSATAIIVLVGLIAIAATWKLSIEIREKSDLQLKNEEIMEASINRQYLAEQAFKDKLKAADEERAFNRFLYGTPSPPPEVVQRQIEQHLRKMAEQGDEHKTP